MKKPNKTLWIIIGLLICAGGAGAVLLHSQSVETAAVSQTMPAPAVSAGDTATSAVPVYAELPVKGMVTMIDLGADNCIPCKMMAPILKKVENDYRGRAAIVFLDVRKDSAPARRFNIRVIPTQIFFDQDGREVLRHEGFMDEATIVRHLRRLGVPSVAS